MKKGSQIVVVSTINLSHEQPRDNSSVILSFIHTPVIFEITEITSEYARIAPIYLDSSISESVQENILSNTELDQLGSNLVRHISLSVLQSRFLLFQDYMKRERFARIMAADEFDIGEIVYTIRYDEQFSLPSEVIRGIGSVGVMGKIVNIPARTYKNKPESYAVDFIDYGVYHVSADTLVSYKTAHCSDTHVYRLKRDISKLMTTSMIFRKEGDYFVSDNSDYSLSSKHFGNLFHKL